MLAVDTWDNAPETIATDKWIKRELDHLPGPERDEPRVYKRGIPFTEQELANRRGAHKLSLFTEFATRRYPPDEAPKIAAAALKHCRA